MKVHNACLCNMKNFKAVLEARKEIFFERWIGIASGVQVNHVVYTEIRLVRRTFLSKSRFHQTSSLANLNLACQNQVQRFNKKRLL